MEAGGVGTLHGHVRVNLGRQDAAAFIGAPMIEGISSTTGDVIATITTARSSSVYRSCDMMSGS
jgi:uncharacterized protein (DUF849 family)